MAEVINTNVIEAGKKFVDFSGLDYFWTKAKTYIDGVDASMSAKVVALENTVGDSTKGLVKDVKSIQDELNSLSGGAGSIATQINNAIAALDLVNTYEAKGEAAKVETAAKSYADGLAVNYDAAGAAATAEQNAKDYADDKFQIAGDYEAAGTAAAAIEALKLSETYEAKGAAAEAQAAAIAQAKLDAAEALKAYYTKTEVDNLLSTNSTGDRAYAKQYTDELFNSIQFAANSDIDALFVPKAE